MSLAGPDFGVEEMLLWLESQTIPVIALLVFALCYGLAAIVFFAVQTLSRRPIAEQLSATTPVMLTQAKKWIAEAPGPPSLLVINPIASRCAAHLRAEDLLRCGISTRPMSAAGQHETSRERDGTSGLPSATDILGECRHGR
jgi:hypothetical protein